MTDSLLRRAHHVIAPVQRRDIEAAQQLCATDPVANVVPAMHLERARDLGIIPTGLWAVRRRSGLTRELAGVVWMGANFTAVLADSDSHSVDHTRDEVARSVASHLSRPAALVGEAELTLGLWERLRSTWGPAREIRERQVSMAISTGPTYGRPLDVPDLNLSAVRRSAMDDFDALLPACVHMFTGEVGYDPMLHGRAAYEERLALTIRGGRSYVQYGLAEGRRQVVFKAEVGTVGGGVAQLQGVWVHPELRGRGLARAGLVAVIEAVQANTAPTVSLYVNDFNHDALAAYEAVGFTEVGTFATVML